MYKHVQFIFEASSELKLFLAEFFLFFFIIDDATPMFIFRQRRETQ